MGPNVPSNKIHVILLYEFICFLLAHIGFKAVIFHKQLNIKICHFVVNMLEREVNRVLNVRTDNTRRSS